MYDELVKALRETDFSDGCPCEAEPMCASTDCIIAQAADAIEKLSKDLERSKEWETFWEKEANEALKKFQTTAANMPCWIPVAERLPDVGKEVLCFCRANICFVLGWDGNHWHEGADRYYMSGFVTHWMPLPEPPKEET